MKFPRATDALLREVVSVPEPFALPAQIEAADRPWDHPPPEDESMAQLELFGDRLVAIHVGALQVIEQAPALTDHHQQSAAGAVILLVALKVFGQMVDPLREQSNLHIRRPRVALVQLKLLNRFRFGFHIMSVPQNTGQKL
jgi:hypothetical protein